MADIFLSYASEDRAHAAPLARALAAAGFSVWWDRDIRPGADFAETIETELAAATAVVVVWTEHSARSEWVRDEAAYARRAGKLVPVRLGGAEPPMGFRQIQSLDFRDWQGDALSPEFLALRSAIAELAGHSGVRTAPSRPHVVAKVRSLYLRRRPAILAVTALLACVAATIGYLNSPFASVAIALGKVELQSFPARPDDVDSNALAASYAEAFRQRFTELGIPNELASEGKRAATELIVSGELTHDDETEILTARIQDRRSGATLWSIRRSPSDGAAWEANLAGFALKCALGRRNPKGAAEVFSRYLYGCGHYLESDWTAMHAAGKDVYAASPGDPNALSFYAVAKIGLGWSGSTSEAEHKKFVGEAKHLAEQALALDPQNADALFAMGFSYDEFQYAEQEKWWRPAIDADTGGWVIGRYANFLTAVGRIDEAIDMELRAMQQRRTHGTRAAGLVASREGPAAAARIYDLVRSSDPAYVASEEMITQVFYEDVEKAALSLAGRPDVDNADCLAQVLDARRANKPDRSRFAEACGGDYDFSARCFAIAGDLDAAFREIEAVLDSGGRLRAPHLFWPEMRRFLRDPRFWPLAVRLGLVDYWLDTDQWPDFCRETDLPFDCREKARAARGAVRTAG